MRTTLRTRGENHRVPTRSFVVQAVGLCCLGFVVSVALTGYGGKEGRSDGREVSLGTKVAYAPPARGLDYPLPARRWQNTWPAGTCMRCGDMPGMCGQR